MRAPSSSARIRSAAASPSPSGIRMSMSRTSGRNSRYCSTASGPEPPRPTTSISASTDKMVASDWATKASSSTMSTLMLHPSESLR